MTFLAHAGHWLVNLAYFVPVLGFLGWLLITQIKQRREDRQQQTPQA